MYPVRQNRSWILMLCWVFPFLRIEFLLWKSLILSFKPHFRKVFLSWLFRP